MIQLFTLLSLLFDVEETGASTSDQNQGSRRIFHLKKATRKKIVRRQLKDSLASPEIGGINRHVRDSNSGDLWGAALIKV
jgi:hypothetical protein